MNDLCMVLDEEDDCCDSYIMDSNCNSPYRRIIPCHDTDIYCKCRSRKYSCHGYDNEYITYPACSETFDSHQISGFRRRTSPSCRTLSCSPTSCHCRRRDIHRLGTVPRNALDFNDHRNETVPSKRDCGVYNTVENNYYDNDHRHTKSNRAKKDHRRCGGKSHRKHNHSTVPHHRNGSTHGYYTKSSDSGKDRSRDGENCNSSWTEEKWKSSSYGGHDVNEDHHWNNWIHMHYHDDYSSQNEDENEYSSNVYDSTRRDSHRHIYNEQTFADSPNVVPDCRPTYEPKRTEGRKGRSDVRGMGTVLRRQNSVTEKSMKTSSTKNFNNDGVLKSILKDNNFPTRSLGSNIRQKKSVRFRRMATMITFKRSETKLNWKKEQTVATFKKYNYHTSTDV